MGCTSSKSNTDSIVTSSDKSLNQNQAVPNDDSEVLTNIVINVQMDNADQAGHG